MTSRRLRRVLAEPARQSWQRLKPSSCVRLEQRQPVEDAPVHRVIGMGGVYHTSWACECGDDIVVYMGDIPEGLQGPDKVIPTVLLPAPPDPSGTVRVALTDWHLNGGFNSGVEGVDRIMLTGTSVPTDKVELVQAAADASKVGIEVG